jgi:hypothetical protein
MLERSFAEMKKAGPLLTLPLKILNQSMVTKLCAHFSRDDHSAHVRNA